MSVIAIDSSARRRLAVVRVGLRGRLEASRVVIEAPVLPTLDAALSELLPAELEAVVVVTGPGSYTGLRAGMAAGLGLAHASGVPLHGIGSLDVVAHSAPTRAVEFLAVADAGRGGVYAARFVRTEDGIRLVGAPMRIAPPLPGELLQVALDSLPGVEPADAALALARSVPAALALPPLVLAGLSGTYLD